MAGNGDSKVVREYREDDDSINVPKEKKQQGLYADQVPVRRCHMCFHLALQVACPQKPQDNMSPEMKARLRQEYLNLGGSASTVRTCALCCALISHQQSHSRWAATIFCGS